MARLLLIVFCVGLVGPWVSSSADIIVYRGREYSKVEIEELATQYVVHFPETGRKKYVRKEEVSSVEINGRKVESRRPNMGLDFQTRETVTREQEPKDTSVSAQQSALEQYKQRTKIRAQAKFDAAFEHWAQLGDEQREAFLTGIDAQVAAAEAERRRTAQSIATQRQQLERQIEARRQNIQESANERDAQIRETYNTAFEGPPVDDYGFLSEREGREAEVLDAIAGVPAETPPEEFGGGFGENYTPAPRYYGSAGGAFLDSWEEADAEAYWIEQEYNADIAQENRALRQLAERTRRFDRRSKSSLRRSARRVQRLAGTAAYLRALEEAVANEYDPASDYIDLFSMESSGITQRYVQAALPVLRIDWWVDPSDPLANQLRIRVYDNISNRLITADTSAKLPFEHFLIVERPGDYLIEVEAPANLIYTLEAKEPRDFAYIPVDSPE